MRGILTAELQGAGLKDLLSPTRTLVCEVGRMAVLATDIEIVKRGGSCGSAERQL